MTIADIAGLAGVVLILIAYAGTQFRGLDPTRAPSLLMNLLGASLILASLTKAFNLSAVLMESAWALVALAGLIKLFLKQR
ncbi:MAG TPA: hypothetical protein VGI79_02840 [Caulobacteraceae bacterium]|jgi:hypothetical protein